MTKKKRPKVTPAVVSAVMAQIGERGGLAKVPKGLAKMKPERRKEIALLGVAARRAKRELLKGRGQG